MDNMADLLYEYLLIPTKLQKNDEQNTNLKDETWDICDSIKCEDNWKIFFDTSFDSEQIKIYFTSLSEKERVKMFKFGIACLINFVRCNFTGPDFDKTTENFLKGEKFKFILFNKRLTVNNEEINPNTKFPILLVVSKYIFEWCSVCSIVNIWWYWRSLIIHQQVLDDLSPALLSEADRLYKHIEINTTIKGYAKALLDIEVAQLYLLFRNIPKVREHIESASKILGIHYKLIGALGKRTRYQERDIAQLYIEVTVKDDNFEDVDETNDTSGPENILLHDDVRLNSIEFVSEESVKNASLTNIEQKLFLLIVQELLIAKPRDELQAEELNPFMDLILHQKNSFSVKVVALFLRCKLECSHKRTIERSLNQCEEIINSFNRESAHFVKRVPDVFGVGMPPIWRVEAQYADLLLNIGLVKNALDVYLKIKLWEEVIVCYTILKLRHKAAEVIREQLNIKPTAKLLCLLGDATDDITCYEKAWEMSKKRSHRVQRHWAQYFYIRKQYEKCIPHFEKSVSINPLQSSVWFSLGFAALQVENWQTAATAFRRYTTLEPDGFEAWNNLAQAYIKIGNKRNAHQAILEALKSDFTNWKVWENLLVVSCDISNFSDVIRAYHKILDLKEKYLNTEVLSVLVYNVCIDVNDSDGQPSQRFLKRTRELLGRVTAIYPAEGFVWELYASLAPTALLRLQRLQRAYRGHCQRTWEKNPETSQQVLNVCSQLAEIILSDEIDPMDTMVNSVKLNISSALSTAKKQDWEETKPFVHEITCQLEKINEKIKQARN